MQLCMDVCNAVRLHVKSGLFSSHRSLSSGMRFRYQTPILIILGVLIVGLSHIHAETNFFPIMPWNSPPNDPAVLKKIHECGFTLAGFVPPSALDACQKAGLKAIVSDARIFGYDWASVDATRARTNTAS